MGDSKLWFKLTPNVIIREGGPTIFAQVKHGKNVDLIVDLILSAWKASGASHAGKPPAH